VRLPKVADDTFGKPLKLTGNKTELKYWNYSVVMNADRGLAFFSAGNIMPRAQLGGREGDQFIRDRRVDAVDEEAQIGTEFYKKQSTFEADNRSTNPFDQGHLSRREDLQWGASAQEAKRNGDDSFHYTNCAPQHFAFNQNRKISGLWNRLEVSAVQQLSSGEKICIINGPVFNAPASTAGPDGKLLLQLNGPRKKDLTFGGVSIPKLYFKLIAYRKGDALRAKAFVVSQEDMLATVDRLHEAEASTLSDNELSLYQVKIKDLEDLTGLTFGIPVAADTPHAEELALLEGGRPIYDEEELFL
jgi:endonuclease G